VNVCSWHTAKRFLPPLTRTLSRSALFSQECPQHAGPSRRPIRRGEMREDAGIRGGLESGPGAGCRGIPL